jgi:uncharacterized protein (TIGR00725 family)
MMISVCGPNEATEQEYADALAIGEAIARAGHTVVCGGRQGVMEAAARGAAGAGGAAIGILPGYDASESNPYLTHRIPTGLGHARNTVVVASGDAVIAVGGGFGTLSEIGLALKMGKPVVHIHSWDLDPARVARFSDGDAKYLSASDPEDAVRIAIDAAARHAPGDG